MRPSQKVKGTNLDFRIVKRADETHGSTITAESSPSAYQIRF